MGDRATSLTFVILWYLACATLFVVCQGSNPTRESALGCHASACHESEVSFPDTNQTLRPAFQFRPTKNWMNDPNAPMYYNGVYHMFYQYNPKGPIWGNIVWGHSVSQDLINWVRVEPAIWPSEPFDVIGTWSGSATILPGKGPIILYTGLDKANRNIQNLAYPANLSDPYLTKWLKPNFNPVVTPSKDINASCFRDPTTAWWNNGQWHILVSGSKNSTGMAYLYKSKDFKNWFRAKQPLHSKAGTGNWECADFYPVALKGDRGVETSEYGPSVKHVLKISLDHTRYDYYTVGRYDPVREVYLADNTSVDGWDGLRYDYGNFYASKVFYDKSQSRRILVGWVNESDAQDIKAKGWAGIYVIPRKIWLAPNGKQLIQWPVKELEALRTDAIELPKQTLGVGEYVQVEGITSAQADVEVIFTLSTNLDKAEPFNPKWTNPQDLCGIRGSTVQGGVGPFGVLTLASRSLEEFTPIFFRIFKAKYKYIVLMCSDARSSSLDKDNYKPSFAGFVDTDLRDRKLPLRILIDHSVVESFGANGKTVITSRVYPTIARLDEAHLFLFNNGTEAITVEKVSAWSMKNPEMNNN